MTFTLFGSTNQATPVAAVWRIIYYKVIYSITQIHVVPRIMYYNGMRHVRSEALLGVSRDEWILMES